MQDRLSQKFAALAHPTRRAMLAMLATRRATVSEVAAPFRDQMSLPAVTRHLKVLESAGLVTKTRDAQRRMCKLNVEELDEAVAYLESYRQAWEESLDRLGAYLESVTNPTQQPGNAPDHGRED